MGVFPGFILTSTRYAAGFSEPAFTKIGTGSSASTVQQVLGKPLNIETNHAGVAPWTDRPLIVTWWYSEEALGEVRVWWKARAVIFSNEVVTYKISYLKR